jgi:hypothetical protein
LIISVRPPGGAKSRAGLSGTRFRQHRLQAHAAARRRAIGPLGFAGPISDLSRGDTIDDIVINCAVVLATAGPP